MKDATAGAPFAEQNAGLHGPSNGLATDFVTKAVDNEITRSTWCTMPGRIKARKCTVYLWQWAFLP